MIEIPFKRNYLAMIENSAKGENWMFKNFYIIKDGVEVDALENGGLSCAALVSSILYLQNSFLEFTKKSHWIGFTHATVASTEKDMLEHGWYQVQDLKVGAVIIWEKQTNEHIGFCISETEALSNDSSGVGFPHTHHVTFDGTRNVEKIYWHKDLDNG